jgi:TetR/AcrR family transcriptional repressor of nem operon
VISTVRKGVVSVILGSFGIDGAGTMMTIVIWLHIDGDRHIFRQGIAATEGGMMRVTREKAAENREKIVTTAARLFRENGFDGVGLDAIMESAGLTHGGFYRHFGSKRDLAAEAVAHGLATSADRQAALPSLEALVSGYLSPEHRANRGNGCVIAALGSDMSRQGKKVRRALTAHARAQIDRLAGWTDGPNAMARRRRAIATLAGMVGTLILARAVEDVALSDEILAAGRTVFSAAPCRKTAGKSMRD